MPTKHGQANRGNWGPEYYAWRNMIERCRNPKRINYRYYGGRGIKVCAEWQHDFSAFLSHIGPKPSKEFTLDRIDTNRNYEPGNVRWADRLMQRRNRRDSITR